MSRRTGPPAPRRGPPQPPLPIATTIEIDAYRPAQIAERVEQAGVAKAQLPAFETLVLAVLAGAFIAFGAMYFTVAMTDHGLGFGPSRVLGGLVFSLGLILVVIAGAELFTGNALIVMAWVEGKVGGVRLLRNWALVLLGNVVGAVGIAVVRIAAGGIGVEASPLGRTAAGIAVAKAGIDPLAAFASGILCNALVCLAVWLAFAARDVTGKILAIVFPISAFVAMGFEHSIANVYFFAISLLAGHPGVTLAGAAHNLVPVTIGNVVGGGGFVALTYWLCYRRGAGA